MENDTFSEPTAARPATDDVARAQRAVALWQLPTIPDRDIPVAVGIPATLWSSLKAAGDSPALFTIGRRLFVKTDDLRSWLDAKAATGRPGSKRLRSKAPA